MSPQTVVCDECRVNVAGHIISFLDGSRVPLALCQEHLIQWNLTYLMDTLPDEALFQVAAALMPELPAPPAAEAEQQPPKRRGQRRRSGGAAGTPEEPQEPQEPHEVARLHVVIPGPGQGMEEPASTSDDG